MAPKLPRTPDRNLLRRIGAATVTVPANTLISRVYMRGGSHPTTWGSWRYFGPLKSSRFDHHLLDDKGMPSLQDRGIAYGAVAAGNGGTDGALACCLAEVYQKNRSIDPHENQPWWAVFWLAADLLLLDLRGAWPTRAGASQAINSGARSSTRAWAHAFYEEYPDIHGLIYPSSMCGGIDAVALNERAGGIGAIPAHAHHNYALSDPKLSRMLRKAARKIGYTLLH